jgi:hypothetical protein
MHDFKVGRESCGARNHERHCRATLIVVEHIRH